MKYIKQLSIILIISLIGEVLHFLIPLPIPASIYGIVILFCCLQFKIIALEKVKDVGKFLIEIMPIMFIPAAVELLESWHLISSKALEYILIMILSTLIVMVVSGRVTQAVIHMTDKKKGESKND